MNWFKNLFGSKALPKTFLPRPPRVQLQPLQQILFRHRTAGGTKNVELSNISEFGMGLVHEDHLKFRRNDKLEGSLLLGITSYEVEARVQHVNKKIVGCLFSGDFKKLRKAVAEYFEIEIAALGLRRINPSMLQPDPRGEVLWFTDSGRNEVHIVRDQKGILEFHCAFLGNYVEGGRDQSVRAGHVLVDVGSAGKMKASNLVHIQADASKQVLPLCGKLLENLNEIDPELRKELLRMVRGK